MNKVRKRKRRDRSTIEKELYGGIYIFMVYIAMLFLWEILPKVYRMLEFHQNYIKYVSFVLVTSVVGYFLTYKNERTYSNVIKDMCIAAGLYVLSTVGPYTPLLVKSLIGVFLLLTVIGIFLTFIPKIKNIKKRRKIILRRISLSLLLVRRNLFVMCIIASLIIPVVMHFTPREDLADRYYEITGKEKPGQYSVAEIYDKSYNLSNNIDTIKLIKDNETFQKLSYEKKCQVIEAIVYCEARCLGLCKINLKFEELDGSILGYYSHSERTICIDSKPLKDGTKSGGTNNEILNTILHECRHCYQHRMIDLYSKLTPEERNLYAFKDEDVAQWAANSQNYISCWSDGDYSKYEEYYNQILEKDARKWAAFSSSDYFREIEEELWRIRKNKGEE